MRQLLGVAALLVLPFVVSAQALAIKTGGWELTHRMQVDGKEETSVEKSCVRKSELESMEIFIKSEGCTHNIKSRTSTRWALTSTCTQGGTQSKSEIDLAVANPESFAMKVATQITTVNKKQSVQIETAGRWRSASCEGFNE